MTSYCVFNVGERRIGIPMAVVREIIEHHLVVPTPVPLTPPFVHGLFNLRGQVLPWLDLSPFVGATEKPAPPGRDDRAVIVERGNFRFALTGRRIDTIEADPAKLQPLNDAAVHPALDGEAHSDSGAFQVLHLDRLEACLIQSLKLSECPGASVAPATPKRSEGGPTPDPKSETQGPSPETLDPN